MKPLILLAALLPALAWADAVDTLRGFIRDVKSGRAAFTQTVFAPSGEKRRSSSGQFEFVRPNRFKFAYQTPFEQLIVADGQKVWIYDPDLNQVTVRRIGDALGATPAALLAGGAIERDFDLKPLAERDGLQWAEATPKSSEGQFQVVRVGFRGKELAAVDIVDSFGQRSLLQFSRVEANAPVPADAFRFTPPAGVDVIEQ